MYKRKIIAMVIVAVMVLSMTSVTALANDQTGTSSSISVNTRIIAIALPTAAGFGFTLDPQGLLGLQDGESKPLEELADHAGKIVFNEAYAPTVISSSSIPVDLGVSMGITGTATVAANTAALTGSANSLFIEAFHSTDNVTATPTSVNEIVATTASLAKTAVTAAATADHLNFWLDKANYVAKNTGGTYTYELVQGNATAQGLQGTQFVLEGRLNKEADWSSYAAGATGNNTVGMDIKFAFRSSAEDAKPDSPAGTTAGHAYIGLVATALFASGEQGAQPAGPTIGGFQAGAGMTNVTSTSATFTSSGAGWKVIPFDFGGKGTMTAINTGNNADASTFFLLNSNGDPTLHLNATGWPAGTYTFKITVSEGGATEYNLTFILT